MKTTDVTKYQLFSDALQQTLCLHTEILVSFRKYIAGTAMVDVAPESTTAAVRRVRLPQVGLYDHPIVCILVSMNVLLRILKFDTQYLEGISKRAIFFVFFHNCSISEIQTIFIELILDLNSFVICSYISLKRALHSQPLF